MSYLLKKDFEDMTEYDGIGVKYIIDSQPTTFDVDKIIKQVSKIEVNRSEYSEIVNCNLDDNRHCGSSCYECILANVVDIIKGSDKNE